MPPFHGPTSPPPGTGLTQLTVNLELLVFLFWLIFIVYWIMSAQGIKKNIKTENDWRRTFGVRILVIIAIILAINFLGSGLEKLSFSPPVQVIGIFLTAVGLAFAIWARWHLGTNWNAYPAIKEKHELVTSGPYSFVRHPIYTGAALALFGSTLAGGFVWLVVFITFSIMVIWRIKTEEGFMMKLFPDAYPAYKKKTKALIPFVW